MIVNHEYKYVFVAVAKTACTSIQRSLGNYIDHQTLFDGTIARDPPPEIYHMCLKDILNKHPDAKDYFKLGFVRNPYDRLVSAYYDFRNSVTHREWAYPIYKYEGFRDFVLDLNDGPCKDFIHLRPQYDYLEYEDSIGVDFIGRFENLLDDFRSTVSRLGLNARELPHWRNSGRQHSWQSEYDEETTEVVYEFYKKDFEQFGYEK